jgi:hypothetical protein
MKKYREKVWNERIKPKFPPFSALGVILIALAYIVYIQSAAWYVKFIDFIYGQPLPKAAEPILKQVLTQDNLIPKVETHGSMIIDVKKILKRQRKLFMKGCGQPLNGFLKKYPIASFQKKEALSRQVTR